MRLRTTSTATPSSLFILGIYERGRAWRGTNVELCFAIMGQENSAPSRNRLSKPRTNNSALNLLSRSALHLDRKDGKDAPQDVPGHENRYSVIFANAEVRVDVVKEEEKQKESKRRSIFRSFSTPDRHQEPKVEKEVGGENKIYQWSDPTRKASITEEIQFYEERYYDCSFARKLANCLELDQ